MAPPRSAFGASPPGGRALAAWQSQFRGACLIVALALRAAG